MNAQRTAGVIALSSGALLVLALIASAFTGSAALGGTPGTWWSMGPGMMDAAHAAHMGNAMGGMGPGMMGFGPSGPAATAIPSAPEVRVQATNFAFTPTEIRLPKNADVNLTLANAAGTGVVHDLTVPALGIHLVAAPGESRNIGLRALAAGRYDAYCSVPGHADLGMRATVIVE